MIAEKKDFPSVMWICKMDFICLTVYLALVPENQTRHSAMSTGLSFELVHDVCHLGEPRLPKTVRKGSVGWMVREKAAARNHEGGQFSEKESSKN